MSSLRLFLFGTPRLEQHGQPVALRRSKALALLAYLTVTRQPQSRETLTALLWPEFDGASARNNLRRELSLLKTTLGVDVLSVDRMQVAHDQEVDLWLDVAAFRTQVSTYQQHGHPTGELCEACTAALTDAAQLYTDDFMAGFSLPDSSAFDDWQFFQREELRQQYGEVLQLLIGWQRAEGQYSDALAYARRWLALDSLHEPAHRELMRLYAWSGQQSAALRQYDECARVLQAELGVEPEQETTELRDALRTRRFSAPAHQEHQGALPPVTESAHAAPAATLADPPAPEAPPAPADGSLAHNLPPTTGFVGRQREVADIIRRLTDPACRLLTLTGPGGIGKTRLALQTAHTLAEGWSGEDALADGVLFVPLAAVSTPGGIVSALAAAAHFDFYPNVSPKQQVLDYFRARRMLLLLDSFDHLLDGAEIVAELLAAAPRLRILVTSRETLNLHEEWFHPIEGLSFPAEADKMPSVAQLARYDAVRLFEQSARRVRSDFSLYRERAPVVRLCRLVEGMPLAIELAAAWLKVLSVQQVVDALERGLDILTARDRNIPERHRSMRTVLEGSWELLSPDEQHMLAGLTVFRGGFSADAAEAVTDASLGALANLVEKSLLRTDADGRFYMHELLRQFVAEKLAADSGALHAAQARHSAYYLDFVTAREARLLSHDQSAAAAEIAREVANVRVAWLWAVANQQFRAIERALYSCFVYYHTQSRFQEGDELFTQVMEAAAPADDPVYERVRARAYIRGGAFRYLLGDYTRALHSIESALSAAHEHHLKSDIACAHLTQGVIAGNRGNAPAARDYLNQGLEIGWAIDDKPIVADALHELARLFVNHGEYAEGKRLAHESLAVSRAANLSDWSANALHAMAWASVCCGEYADAEAYWREALELFESLGSLYGAALARGGIGWVSWCVGGDRLPQAHEFTAQSLAILRTLGHRLSVSSRLGDLALIAIDRGDYAQAQIDSQEGLALARELGSTVYMASNLCVLGHVASAHRQFATSRRYLGEALQCTVASQLWPRLAFTLYHIAVLLGREADALGDGPRATARKLRALELLASVAHHPASWHVYRARAARLMDNLRRGLPPEQVAAAIARGQNLDWEVQVEALLDELQQPAA